MLYVVGPVIFSDDNGNDLQEVNEKVTADFAKHPLIDSRKDYEFAGPGEDPIELRGHLLPYHLGGLDQYELARSLCSSGQAQFVVRSDGLVRGWHHIMEVSGRHRLIGPGGVGFEVEAGMRLEACGAPGVGTAGDLIGTLISLFE